MVDRSWLEPSELLSPVGVGKLFYWEHVSYAWSDQMSWFAQGQSQCILIPGLIMNSAPFDSQKYPGLDDKLSHH